MEGAVRIDILAGMLAGMAEQVVDYPFDTVKTRLQCMSRNKTTRQRIQAEVFGRAAAGSTLWRNVVFGRETTSMPRSTSTLTGGRIRATDVFRTIVREEGAQSLYHGFSVPLVFAMVEYSLGFTIYAETQNVARKLLAGFGRGQAKRDDEPLSLSMLLGCAAVTGFMSVNFLTPMELVKVRLQQPYACCKNRTPWKIASGIVRREGLRGLFRGYTATAAREVPGMTAWFGCYEGVCKALTPVGGKKGDLSSATVAFAGGCSGAMYCTAFYPADVVKTLMQRGGYYKSKSFYFVMRSAYLGGGPNARSRKASIRNLYRGYSIALAKGIPASAANFATFEYATRLLSQRAPAA